MEGYLFEQSKILAGLKAENEMLRQARKTDLTLFMVAYFDFLARSKGVARALATGFYGFGFVLIAIPSGLMFFQVLVETFGLLRGGNLAM